MIETYMKHKYRTTQIGGDPDSHKIVYIDECLILHDNNNNQIWLVWAIESRSKKLRLDVINIRKKKILEFL